jgi:hypothetical protein
MQQNNFTFTGDTGNLSISGAYLIGENSIIDSSRNLQNINSVIGDIHHRVSLSASLPANNLGNWVILTFTSSYVGMFVVSATRNTGDNTRGSVCAEYMLSHNSSSANQTPRITSRKVSNTCLDNVQGWNLNERWFYDSTTRVTTYAFQHTSGSGISVSYRITLNNTFSGVPTLVINNVLPPVETALSIITQTGTSTTTPSIVKNTFGETINGNLAVTNSTTIISPNIPPLFIQRNTGSNTNGIWTVMELCAKKGSGSFGNGLGCAMIFSNDSFESGLSKISHAQITTRLTDDENNTAELVISPYNVGSVRNFIFSGKTGNLNIPTAYLINETSVLSNNTLGSGVVNSSLTSVGTLSSLAVTNNINSVSGNYQVGGNTLIDSSRNASLRTINSIITGSGTAPDIPTGTWCGSIKNENNIINFNGLLVTSRWNSSTGTIFEAGMDRGIESNYASAYKIRGDLNHYWNENQMFLSSSNLTVNGNINSVTGNYQVGGTTIISSSRIAQNIVRYDMSDTITDQLIFRKTHRTTHGDKKEKNIKLQSRFSDNVLAGFGGELDFSISTSNLGDIDLGFLRWNLQTTASGGRGDISIFARPNSTDPYNEYRFRGDGIMLLKTIGGINDPLNIVDNLNFENNEGIRWGSTNCQIIGNASNNNINITSNNLNISNTLITCTQTNIISGNASPLFVQRNAPNTSNVSWNVIELCSNKPSTTIGDNMGIAMIFSNDENSANKITHGRITTRTTDSEKNTCEILISPYNAGSARDFIFSGKTGDLTIAGQYLQSSSLKYKEEIVELPEEIMNDFNKLKPKKYKAKNTNIINYGLIAEEVYEINDSYKNLVHKRNDEIDALNYMGFIPILVKKIQEQQEYINTQQEQINSLTNIINDLVVRMNNLENN